MSSGSKAHPIDLDALYTAEVVDLTGDDVIKYPGKTIGDGLEVRRSNLPLGEDGEDPGNGLFATMDFSKGDVITIYDGEVIESTLAKERGPDGRPKRPQTHMKSINTYTVIDGLKQPVAGRGGGSFLNDPRGHFPYNAEMVRVDCVEARGRNKGIPVGVYVAATSRRRVTSARATRSTRRTVHEASCTPCRTKRAAS